MIVLDASVVVKAYLEEPGSDEAIAVLAGHERLAAPELIRVEVAAALCRRVRKGELSAEEARLRCTHWLERLRKDLFRLTPDQDLLSDAVELATELKHPLQDCLYLATARRFDVPLITADRSFRDRAFPFDSRVALFFGWENN
jgi:predicted nucleic acid-binding protein